MNGVDPADLRLERDMREAQKRGLDPDEVDWALQLKRLRDETPDQEDDE